MKLPVQPLELRPGDEPNRQLAGRFSSEVRPSGDIECALCKAACQLLSGPAKIACLTACELTVC
jgi:hypothetical protein